MISVAKPGSPAELLEHSGVKGMKWGVRRSRNAQATANATAQFLKKNPTSGDRSRAIQRARANNIKRATDFRTERNKTKKAELKMSFLKNPDRATALRMSRGEKIVLSVIAVGIPGPGTVGVAAAVGSQVAVRRHIEKKQARGGYK